jgi:hypothetical protein
VKRLQDAGGNLFSRNDRVEDVVTVLIEMFSEKKFYRLLDACRARADEKYRRTATPRVRKPSSEQPHRSAT